MSCAACSASWRTCWCLSALRFCFSQRSDQLFNDRTPARPWRWLNLWQLGGGGDCMGQRIHALCSPSLDGAHRLDALQSKRKSN
mmetsp:Transcript_75718/g.225748  ORF Transcript_75718/g.225748 Transcript_75718/m.225748 type:complete len:84 (-) Transcript_75718:9-260(-)